MLRVVGDEAVKDGEGGRSLLDEIAREGARRMLLAALEAEVAAYLEAHRESRDEGGHALVVRNGKGGRERGRSEQGRSPGPVLGSPTGAGIAMANDAGSPVASCRRTCVAPRRWQRSYPCSTSGACPPVISARRSRLCSATMPRDCPPPTSRA